MEKGDEQWLLRLIIVLTPLVVAFAEQFATK
jgi:hypothetical protein